MLESEDKKDLIPAEEEDIVQSELFIERMPEIFNPGAYKGGVATFVRRNQRLEVGLPGMKVCFSEKELIVWYEALKMWNANGRPESGQIYKPNTSPLSLCEFTDRLYGDERKYRTGKIYRNRIQRWMKNLMMIPMAHYVLTERPDGKFKFALDTFTFLSSAEGLLDKKGKYFDLTKITIHPHIVRNLLAHNMKPVRLDVLKTLKGPKETCIFRELDLVLSKKAYGHPFEKELIPFCNDLSIHYKQARDYRAKIKPISVRLNGKPLSSDSILSNCVIEERHGVDWIIARKGRLIALPAPKKVPASIPKQERRKPPEDLEFEERKQFLLERYENLDAIDRKVVDEICNQKLKADLFKNSEFTKEGYFLNAIESYLKQELVKKHIFNKATNGFLPIRETTQPENEYRRSPNAPIVIAVQNLQRALLMLAQKKIEKALDR